MTEMKTINFSKMHGLGNDFMVVDATKEAFTLSNQQIDILGNRKTGIGFDQLLVVETSNTENVDFHYRIFNTNGVEAEHCGNGARCFAKFVIDKKLTDKQSFIVKIKKGIMRINYRDDNHIEVDIDKPILLPSEIPFNIQPNTYQKQYQLTVNNDIILASVLAIGNPHVVVIVSDLWQLSIEEMGQALQQSDYFPESVNVNFVEIKDRKNIELRTYERGVGETNACGTGACASAFAAHTIGAVDSQVTVKVFDGSIGICMDTSGKIFMMGSAKLVFDGKVTI